MAYPFIQARWYTKGPRRGPVNKIVLHTIERNPGIDGAEVTAQWLKGTDRQVSAHHVLDDDSVIQCVHYSDIAWAAPGANHDGIQLEMANRAAATTADWFAHMGLLHVVAADIASIHISQNIPIRWCSAAEMVADPNAKGVTTHAEVNRAFHHSNHTDPGVGFPIDFVLNEARAMLNHYAEDYMPAKLIRKTSTGEIQLCNNGFAAPFTWADPNNAPRNLATIDRLAQFGIVEKPWVELDDDAFDALPRLK